MKNKKIVVCIITIVLVVLSMTGAIITACQSCYDFWSISVGEIVTIFIAIFIVYIASTFKDNENKIKSLVEYELDQLRKLSDECVLFDLKIIGIEKYKNEVNMFFTRVDNKITILEKKAKELNYLEGIAYISEELKELQDFVSDKIEDFNYLCESVTVFKKHLNKVSDKALEIIFSFYR